VREKSVCCALDSAAKVLDVLAKAAERIAAAQQGAGDKKREQKSSQTVHHPCLLQAAA
jgi:hypothetical protein